MAEESKLTDRTIGQKETFSHRGKGQNMAEGFKVTDKINMRWKKVNFTLMSKPKFSV